MKYLAVLVIFLVKSGSGSGEIDFKNGSPHVKLDGGELKGALDFSRDGRPFISFFGVKYANVPERFAESIPSDNKLDGIKLADKPGPVCIQPPFISTDNANALGVEDCLNLNIFIPMSTKAHEDWEGYPVMVWIHGGGFKFGSGHEYGPNFFMDEPIILVTINYRLGVFGFLSTGDDVIPGNLGLKDDILALKWVQKNIKSFGGNPEKVTLFGESAGAVMTNYLLLSPSSKGLFQRAISQSGSALMHITHFPNPREHAVELATYLKCPTKGDPSKISSKEILTCLKNVPADELAQAQLSFKDLVFPANAKSAIPFAPSSDSTFLPESSYSILNSHWPLPNFEIPWIIGLNEDEGAAGLAGVILVDDKLIEQLDKNWMELAPKTFNYDKLPKEELEKVSKKLKQFYFGSKPVSKETRQAVIDLMSDSMFNFGVWKASREMAKRGQTVYFYHYCHHGPSLLGLSIPSPEEQTKQISHGDELVLEFELGIAPFKAAFEADPKQEEFSKRFINLWTTFAQTGKPNNSWINTWKPLSTESMQTPKWQEIDLDPRYISVDEKFLERMQFWEELYKEHFYSTMSSSPYSKS